MNRRCYKIALFCLCILLSACEKSKESVLRSSPEIKAVNPMGILLHPDSAIVYMEATDSLKLYRFSVQLTKAFSTDSTEVTQKQFIETIKNFTSDYPFPTQWFPHDTLQANGAKKPADGLSWYDAIFYCNARSKQEGYDTLYTYSALTLDHRISLENIELNTQLTGYRLPTLAEWFYALFGESDNIYPWGNSYHFDSLAKYAWTEATIEAAGQQSQIQNVASLSPTAPGIYDLLGNVSEYVHDYWEPNFPKIPMLQDWFGTEIKRPTRTLVGFNYQTTSNTSMESVRKNVLGTSPKRRRQGTGFRSVLQIN